MLAPHDFQDPKSTKSAQMNPDDTAVEVSKRRRNRRRRQAQKNWLLRGAMLIGIIVGVALVWWMISPNANGQNFWLYWFSNSTKTTEETTGNIPLPEDSLSANSLATVDSTQPPIEKDSVAAMQNEWGTVPVPVETEPQEVMPGRPVVSEVTPKLMLEVEKVVAETAPAANTRTVYYVQAGSFKSRVNAVYRQRDLMGGGYRAKIHDPQQAGENYIVTAGPYQNFKEAQDEAESIGFILEIKTSVIKKQE